LAIVIRIFGAGVSLTLLNMIGVFTNLFYFQSVCVRFVSPYDKTITALLSIGGGLNVRMMVRFGSEQKRGDGG
jgi:hypothetical protein